MVNPVRGEQVLEIAGQRHVLCLTLGALAEIEAIGSEAGRLDARKLWRVLGALLRGGGNPVEAEVLAAARLDLDTVAAAVTACFGETSA